MSVKKGYISRITPSICNCDACNSPLQLVEILNDELRVQEDYLECEICGKRIESELTTDEYFPAASGSLL